VDGRADNGTMHGHISPGLASLMIQIQVFFTIGLSMRLSDERLQRVQWLALALATAGIGVIVLHTDGSTTVLSLGLIVLAALSWAGGNILAREAGRVNMVWRMWCGPAFLRYRPGPHTLVIVRGLGCGQRGHSQRQHTHRVGRSLAGLRQLVVWLRGLGLAAGTLPSGHHHTDGLTGTLVRHGQRRALAR
jgi:hypothetical protein